MLPITIPACPDSELYDEANNEFITVKGLKKDCKLQLEHSLVSVSKWESKWHKSFIKTIEREKLTQEETLDYIKCMTLDKNVDGEVYKFITQENLEEIVRYINDPMTATTVTENHKASGRKQIVTSELIYYWMISLNIPVEFEKWHLNRLLTLIRVCNAENQPPKKMSQKEIMSRNAALNAARKKQFNTKG